MSERAQGKGVAEAIGIVKWVFIALTIGVGVVSILNIELNTTMPRWTEVGVGLATVMYAVVIWVVFGLAEYALQNLIQIEHNTRPYRQPTGDEWAAEQARRQSAGM